MIGKYVTAKEKDSDKIVQGWVKNENPLIIEGLTGRKYECEGEPAIVENPLYIRRECVKS